MGIFCILFFILIGMLVGTKPRLQTKIIPNGSYISRARTTVINGVFIWIVFIRHMRGYGFEVYGLEYVIAKGVGALGQCCVATFLFYSGFGIMSSLKKKGDKYCRKLLTVRLPTLLLHTAIAVCIFWCVQSLYGETYETIHILLSLVTWYELGNSNWYIFITLSSYILIAISYIICQRVKNEAAIAICTLFLFVYEIFFLIENHKAHWWYDSCLCIPAGMLFFVWRTRIECGISKFKIPAWIWGIILVPLSVLLYNFAPWANYMNNIATIMFALGITLFSSCITMQKQSSFLCWCGGSALFYLYIFQRIPMIVGIKSGWDITHPLMYQTFCITCTLMIAFVSVRIFQKIDSLVQHK